MYVLVVQFDNSGLWHVANLGSHESPPVFHSPKGAIRYLKSKKNGVAKSAQYGVMKLPLPSIPDALVTHRHKWEVPAPSGRWVSVE